MYDRNSINKVILIGNLGADPEVRTTQSGAKVVNFRLATNERGKDSMGNIQDRTQWHRIVAWDKLGELCAQYLKTGSKVYVEGRINYKTYEKDGQTTYFTDIIAQNIQFVDNRGGSVDYNSNDYDHASNEAPSHQPKQGGGGSQSNRPAPNTGGGGYGGGYQANRSAPTPGQGPHGGGSNYPGPMPNPPDDEDIPF
jgi:single-strand DNA-binding protein